MGAVSSGDLRPLPFLIDILLRWQRDGAADPRRDDVNALLLLALMG